MRPSWQPWAGECIIGSTFGSTDSYTSGCTPYGVVNLAARRPRRHGQRWWAVSIVIVIAVLQCDLVSLILKLLLHMGRSPLGQLLLLLRTDAIKHSIVIAAGTTTTTTPTTNSTEAQL